MQNYFRSAITISTGLVLSYGSAFAAESGDVGIFLLDNRGLLESSLANEPLRAPLPVPQKESSFEHFENAYVERDNLNSFLECLSLQEKVGCNTQSKWNRTKTRSHRRVAVQRTIK